MEKLGNQQTKNRIADMLRNEILSGRIADGEELAQEQLAEQLEVSRMPVREALQHLELEGFLIRLPNRHMQVVGINKDTLFDSMRVLAAVEAEIALILLERGASSPPALEDVRQLHSWFSQQLGNHYLRQIHDRLLAGYPRYIWDTCAPSERTAAYHTEITDAFVRRDATSLHSIIHQYYQALAKQLMTQAGEDSHE